jgi:hypothetical protein
MDSVVFGLVTGDEVISLLPCYWGEGDGLAGSELGEIGKGSVGDDANFGVAAEGWPIGPVNEKGAIGGDLYCSGQTRL